MIHTHRRVRPSPLRQGAENIAILEVGEPLRAPAEHLPELGDELPGARMRIEPVVDPTPDDPLQLDPLLVDQFPDLELLKCPDRQLAAADAAS